VDPDPADVSAGPPQTFPDPDLDRSVPGYLASSAGLFEAARLATAILHSAQLDAWADLPDDAWEVLDSAGIVLTAEQAELLATHDAKLSYLRRSMPKRGDRPGRKAVSIAVCPLCDGWRLVSSGLAGGCPASLRCTGKPVKATGLDPIAPTDNQLFDPGDPGGALGPPTNHP
jgi:hypothetical protein